MLVQEIRRWRARSAFYRIQNITYFMLFRTLIPFGSLAVASSTFADLRGEPLFAAKTILIIAILVVVLSGLDSVLNPGVRKRVGFKVNNALRELEGRILASSANAQTEELRELILKGHLQLKEVLDDYADQGY